MQVARRVDQEIPKGNSYTIELAFEFIELVKNQSYLSIVARRYKTEPLVKELSAAFDDFPRENDAVKSSVAYSNLIPEDLMGEYVISLTKTYVGRMGSSARWSRTDFYADGAAMYIPEMFESFDDNAAQHFVDEIKKDNILKNRIQSPAKMRRLRTLGNIVLEKVSTVFQDKPFLEALCDESREKEFFQLIRH